jgi:hypothetical protein
MKKVMLVIVGILMLFMAFGAAGLAFAQSQTPPEQTPPWGPNQGGGMMGHFGAAMMRGTGYGPMHEYMEQALADKLGLTEEEIEEKLAAGETMWSIAQAQGLTDQEISDLMLAARDEGLKAAVAAGTLSQEQADWMSQHMQQMRGQGMGAGGCAGGGMHGARQGMGRWFNQP